MCQIDWTAQTYESDD